MTNKSSPKETKKIGKIKSSVFSRTLSLAKLSVGASSKIAMHGISTLWSSPEKKTSQWNELLKNQAASIAQELGELKGSLMKAGQMLSVYGEHFLPKEANELLKSLQMDSSQVSWEQMHRVLLSEIGPEKLGQLEIHPEPIGSASLGQVYRAKIKDSNQWVAVKVQYPGVDKAIDSDLKALKSFLVLLKLIPNGPYMDAILDEIKSMLLQEVDYKIEARSTQEYKNLVANDERFVVPTVYEGFSTSKVLTTSLETGFRPDAEEIQNLNQSRRNKISENFLELYFKELFQWGSVQTDPHLGNYKIRVHPQGNDQIVLLDFGAVRKFPIDFLTPYRNMIKAAHFCDTKALHEQAKKLKFIFSTDKPELIELFESFCLLTVEPFRDLPEGYDWKISDLPTRLTKKALKIVQSFSLRAPPREIVFLDRKTAGVFIFLSVLGAKLNGRPLLDSFVKDL
jgi:predicted unusual protein kinase regulating ubiquinone biosynthesis (AarF/ABC1/UbiB family)